MQFSLLLLLLPLLLLLLLLGENILNIRREHSEWLLSTSAEYERKYLDGVKECPQCPPMIDSKICAPYYSFETRERKPRPNIHIDFEAWRFFSKMQSICFNFATWKQWENRAYLKYANLVSPPVDPLFTLETLNIHPPKMLHPLKIIPLEHPPQLNDAFAIWFAWFLCFVPFMIIYGFGSCRIFVDLAIGATALCFALPLFFFDTVVALPLSIHYDMLYNFHKVARQYYCLL